MTGVQAGVSPLILLALGLSVLPSGGGRSGKRPLVRWEEYQRRRPTEAEVTAWGSELHPKLWGTVTGAISGVVVGDADTPEARAKMGSLEPHVRTPRGGAHYYFKHPGHRVKTCAGLLPGLDIRGDGGFVNLLGVGYTILRLPTSEALYPFSKLPEAIRLALDPPSRPGPGPTTGPGDIIAEGQRNAHLTSLAGTMQRRDMPAQAVEAALLVVNSAQCQPPLPESEVLAIARSVSRYTPDGGQAGGNRKHPVCGFVLEDGTVGELVLETSGRRAFVVASQGHVRRDDQWPAPEGGVYMPCQDPLIGEVVHFPLAASPFETLAALYQEVLAFIRRYVELPDGFYPVAALYVLLSWIYDAVPVVPYLRFIGEPGSGKTRALQVVGSVCFRPIFASGATSASPIFRIIAKFRGTLCVDEADFKDSDLWMELVKVLNNGYRPGFPVLRSEKSGEGWHPVAFPVFGPKIIATRRRFEDEALESRCLSCEMLPLARRDIPLLLPPVFAQEVQALRAKLVTFRMAHLHRLKATAFTNDLAEPGLFPRLQEVLIPFKALANDDDGLLRVLTGFVKGHQERLLRDKRESPGGRVLHVLAGALREGQDKVMAHDVHLKVNASAEEDSELTAQKVGAVIKALGLQGDLDTGTRRRQVRMDTDRIIRLAIAYGVNTEGLIPPQTPSTPSAPSPPATEPATKDSPKDFEDKGNSFETPSPMGTAMAPKDVKDMKDFSEDDKVDDGEVEVRPFWR